MSTTAVDAVDPAEPAPRGRLLIVDTDGVGSVPSIELLGANHYETVLTSGGREALLQARGGRFDLILCGWPLPDMPGGEFCDRLREIDPDLPLIVSTDAGDIETAIACIRHGAFDYVRRPLDPAAMVGKIARALEQRRFRHRIVRYSAPAAPRDRFGDLVGRSEVMQHVFQRIAKIAPLPASLIILGESGTGKEMVAREVHRRSHVAAGPFTAINCAGMPGELIESELFGHEKGAFTGATQARDGLFQAASGGTLFLDEIGAMPLPQQASLLRALETKEVRRLGSTRTVKVDVRIVAATNSDLEQAMQTGLFRQDLYYRLSCLAIHLPSLRQRVEDIPLLSSLFLQRSCAEHGKPARRLSPQTVEVLCNRHWAGNVRELEHVIAQAVIFSRHDVIRPSELPFNSGGPCEPELETLEQVERNHILKVIARTAGNKLKAARILGIPRPTLYHRMRKLGIDEGDRRAAAAPRGETAPRRRSSDEA